MLLETDSAFAPGTEWISHDGAGHRVKILSIRRWGQDRWDWDVTYENAKNGISNEKGGWSFQVRYCPVKDY